MQHLGGARWCRPLWRVLPAVWAALAFLATRGRAMDDVALDTDVAVDFTIACDSKSLATRS